MKRAILAFLFLYILFTAYAIVSVSLGKTPSMLLTPISTLAGFIFAALHASQREGWKRALGLIALVFAVSLFFESVGVATGLIYGPYHYTDMLGPKFLGLVPYLIPAAWFMMSYPSFVIADRMVPISWNLGRKNNTGAGHWQRLLAVSAVGGLVMTAWDMIMDPVMVFNGHWVWDVNGAYHGIPLQNYWGWWLTVFTTYGLYFLFFRKPGVLPAVHSDRLTVVSYLVTAFGMILPCLFTGAGELALIGFFSMIPWGIAGALSMRNAP